MIERVWQIGTATLLAGCVQTAPATDAITISNGGGLGGTLTTTIFADDRVRVVTTGPLSQDNVARETVVSGAYGRALTQVREMLAGAIAGAETDVCPDYGTDSISVTPPVDGASGVSVDCPDEDVSTLIRAINAATSATEPL